MNPSDLLSLEHNDMLNRVADLEKRSAEQMDEILGLRASLADCIRRLNLLESSKGTALCPTRETNPKTANTKGPRSNPRRSEAIPNKRTAAKPTADRQSPRNGLTQRPPSKSSSASALDRQGSKEPTFISQDGALRVFLHGRPFTLYLPSSLLENFDLNTPQPAPDETLKLEWVYGYRGRDCRNNLHYLPTGEIVYFVAAVVVLYNIEEQCQRHYLEHTDDVKCIAIHPDRITVATGQVAGHHKQMGKPHVRIWSSLDLRTLRILGLGEFDRGVCCLSFSKSNGGGHLCVVDDAQEHTISIWEWQTGRKITDTKCSTEPVVSADFHPLDESLVITCGKSHLVFWTIEGTKLTRKSALFETGKVSCEKPKFILCSAFTEQGDLLTGDSAGNILLWQRGSCHITQICRGIHEGGIFALCVTQDGHVISGGGKDHRLVFLDAALNPTGEAKELPELHGSVRTIIQGPGEMLLVGTTKNTILQVGPALEISSVMFGHSDEFWALCTHPHTHQFLTAGDDQLVVLWDSLSRQAVWAKQFKDAIHCAAFYPPDAVALDETTRSGDGLGDSSLTSCLVALGSTTGRWLVMDVARHDVIAAHSDGIGEQIECIAYSPDGHYLALGSRDNFIYVYQVLELGRKYTRIGRCAGHSSFVLHLDWSKDSRYLRSVSGAYELLFWTAHDCRQVVSPSTLRDVEWATDTCTVNWSVVGIWPEGTDGSDVNACTVHKDSNLLATADDFGLVKLFRYPACRPHANFHAYTGHSSHVTNVDFLCDGSRLISIGGKDVSVLQWEVCM